MNGEHRFGVIDRDLRRYRRGRAILQRGAQVRHQLRALKYDKAVVKCVALVGFGKTGSDDARNAFELQRRRGLFAARAASKIESAHHDVALLIERVEVRIVIFKCYRRHLLWGHIVAVSVFAAVNAVGVQIVFINEENASTHTWRKTYHDLNRSRRFWFPLGASNSSARSALGEILWRANKSG